MPEHIKDSDDFFWEGGNTEPYRYDKSLRYKQDKNLLMDFCKFANINQQVSGKVIIDFLKQR